MRWLRRRRKVSPTAIHAIESYNRPRLHIARWPVLIVSTTGSRLAYRVRVQVIAGPHVLHTAEYHEESE